MTRSLRLRLFTIILAPLLVIAFAVAWWRVEAAERTALDLFDKSLMFTALAVSRDVALLDGDAISRETEVLLGETAGGPVRYHVHAPDGVFVTGYATPPVPLRPILSLDQAEGKPFVYYDATYQRRDVRALRLKYITQIGGFTGAFTVTVWQDRAARAAFVRDLAQRAFVVIAALIGSVAVVVWFGVNLGLQPLISLEDAISRRNPEDLSPIRRAVPKEARGIVLRLNHLFAQVTRTFEAQAAFISDASHQLRNPIAGVRALGESIRTAPTLEAAHSRADDLVQAAAQAGALADSLMTLERMRASPLRHKAIDLTTLLPPLRDMAAIRRPEVRLPLILPETPVMVSGDATMLREAVKNLIDNALTHGGPDLSCLEITLALDRQTATLTLCDDGQGVSPQDIPHILARFGQARAGPGSGLGLSIVEAVIHQHGGTLTIPPQDTGFCVIMTLPLDRPNDLG